MRKKILAMVLGLAILGMVGVNPVLATDTAPVPQKIEITIDKNPVYTGQGTNQAHAKCTFADGTTKDITSAGMWSSSNEKVAFIVYHTGGMNLSSDGETTLTMDYKGLKASSVLKVIKTPTIVSTKIIGDTSKLAIGESRQFKAIVTLSDGQEIDITQKSYWSFGRTERQAVTQFAKVEHGLLTAIDAGTRAGGATVSVGIERFGISLDAPASAYIDVPIYNPNPLEPPPGYLTQDSNVTNPTTSITPTAPTKASTGVVPLVDSTLTDSLPESTGDVVTVTTTSTTCGAKADWTWNATATDTAKTWVVEGIYVAVNGGADLSKVIPTQVSATKNGQPMKILSAIPKYVDGFGDILEVRLATPTEYSAKDKLSLKVAGLTNALKADEYDTGMEYLIAGQPTSYPRHLPVTLINGSTANTAPIVQSSQSNQPTKGKIFGYPAWIVYMLILLVLLITAAVVIWMKRRRDN